MLDIIKNGYMFFAIGAVCLVVILFFTDSGVQEDISKLIKSGSKTGKTDKMGKYSPTMLLLVGGIIGYGICYMTKDNIEGDCSGKHD